MIRRHFVHTFVVLGLSGCASVSSIGSLEPAVHDSAVDYSQAMDDFTDQVLLLNVLRASEYAPLNFADLSAVTAAFSAQASLGASIPFGPGPAIRGSITPGVQASVSPSLTLGTLNTQGFIMTMIQPISPTYVLSKWNEGYDREFLLHLFVKSIQFP